MTMNISLDTIKDRFNPPKNEELTANFELQAEQLPTIWLFGKTGAGKSSLVKMITESNDVEVGNGFSPCTKSSFAYLFPQDKPLLRFLDTRGLGEADYDPRDDLTTIGQRSHLLVLVAKSDEPEQGDVLKGLIAIKKQQPNIKVLLVHTAVLQSSQQERDRCIAHHQQQFEAVWGTPIPYIHVDFEEKGDDSESCYGCSSLTRQLATLLPEVALLLADEHYNTQEEKSFAMLKKQVLYYAGTASASDLFPVVGLVSVPGIQAKMLHALANQYGIEWTQKRMLEFAGTLGTSFGIRYGVSLGVRQLTKLIPVYGQTVGAVASATISFATTYALGRAAAYYFYHSSRGEEVSQQEMTQLYENTFSRAKG